MDHVPDPEHSSLALPQDKAVTEAMRDLKDSRIVITGAAGLIGQNLILRLKESGFGNLVGIDKHATNTRTLERLHPDVTVIFADLARLGEWRDALADADVLVLGHAQIGGLDHTAFVTNNITATENVLSAAATHHVPYIIHISSSVVNSMAKDSYTETKELQEHMVLESDIPCCVLRPTLMFGWFDRKHLGWLARFMLRTPVFPIPGHGRYLRQPLYSGDFCGIVIACIEQRPVDGIYNISGQEKVDYIDLIRNLRSAIGARARIVRIPYWLFWCLLTVYGWFDRDPPFTIKQLEALVEPDVFEVIDWPGIFGVSATPLTTALRVTFQNPEYSKIELDF